MDIKKLLEYASIDAEMARLNLAFNEEPEVKDYKTLSKRYKDAIELLTKLNAEADELTKQIGALQERYNECMAELNEYKQNAASIEDGNEADFYSKNVEKLIAALTALSNEVAALGKRIADIRQQYSKALAVAADANKRLAETKKSYDVVAARYKPQVDEIRQRLAVAAKAEGLGDVLGVYQNLKKSGVKHPIRPVNDGYCGGCSVWLDNATLGVIDSAGYVQCPNCLRILFNKQDAQ